MIRVVGNIRLFRLLRRTTVNNSHVKCGSFVASTNLQNNLVKTFFLPKNYCTHSDFKDSEQSDNEDCNDHKDMYKNVNFEEITNGDPELTKKLKVLILEIENFRQEGLHVPKSITTDELKNLLLNLHSARTRTKQLKFLAFNEFKAINDKGKKNRGKLDFMKKKEAVNVPNHLNYTVGKNALFLSIRDHSIFNLQYSKMCSAMLHSNDIVFDLDYEKYMTPRQMKQCVKQVKESIVLNRSHINPLNFHLCNFPSNGMLHDYFQTFMKQYKAFTTVQIHEKSYLDVFNPKQLVYLSPHADNILLEYNADDIYIIGGYVDTGTSIPVSFGKAKAEKIRSAKLPTDVYFRWKQGTKSLPLNIVYGIMLDLYFSKDMKKAMVNHVPTRLYYKDHELEKIYLQKQPRKKIYQSQYKKGIHPCRNEEPIKHFEEREIEKKIGYHYSNLHLS